MSPARSVRNLGIVNAEPIQTATTDAGITVAVNSLNLAEPHLSNQATWSSTSDIPNEYRDRLATLVEEVQLTKANARLSDEAKWDAVDELTTAWRTEAEALVARLEDSAASWERDLTAAARPPAPTTDAAVLEAMLSNARQDARMVLDNATDEEAPDRLAEMGRGSDPALAYLVLATGWPATYMRGRGLKHAPIAWDHERGKVLASVLTEKALEAHNKLAGIPHARKAATALRMGHSFLIANNRDYFQDDA